ncbi:hypothetical protein [Marilutibacter aestuarii]|uniref:Uncharacterized protein n=1 Tax=Marilutibacter aestuarii TaxID=1706195 RepID=A0A507ZTY1_9GAMM|nr:hypothetical protein [Lysobacter aestuarii]TQD40397.1 hypothetical protein FKV25_14300 [Lysobacter aestuarii]
MPPKVISRALQMKRVRFKGRTSKGKPIAYPAIDDLLKRIKALKPHWAQRHHPLPNPSEPFAAGTSCSFLVDVRPRTTGDMKGVYFEVGTYTHGAAHQQITLDYSQAEPPLENATLPHDGRHARAISNVIRGVALGETIILDSPKGTGGYGAAQQLLSRLIIQNCLKPPRPPGEPPHKTPTWPGIELMDVMSNDLRREIERGGGVATVYMRVAEATPGEDDSWQSRLRGNLDAMPHASKFHAKWEADDEPLDTDSVLGAVDEFSEDDSTIEALTLELVHGNRIRTLGKFKVRKPIDVTIDSAGVLHTSDIVNGLWQYLDELRSPDPEQWRLIDDNGNFTTHATVSFTTNS